MLITCPFACRSHVRSPWRREWSGPTPRLDDAARREVSHMRTIKVDVTIDRPAAHLAGLAELIRHRADLDEKIARAGPREWLLVIDVDLRECNRDQVGTGASPHARVLRHLSDRQLLSADDLARVDRAAPSRDPTIAAPLLEWLTPRWP